ncbi:MAG TPA: hypothetical protein VH186_19260 [Chloroflexia bacterium]|nr:hypothetical protein [Chloroflexia bacterium]
MQVYKVIEVALEKNSFKPGKQITIIQETSLKTNLQSKPVDSDQNIRNLLDILSIL